MTRATNPNKQKVKSRIQVHSPAAVYYSLVGLMLDGVVTATLNIQTPWDEEFYGHWNEQGGKNYNMACMHNNTCIIKFKFNKFRHNKFSLF
jgi:hypothetical protein